MVPYRSHQTEPLLTGDAGAWQAVRHMRRMVDEAKVHPDTRAAVLDALHGHREKDQEAEVSALFEWVRERVRFVRDPHGVEYLQHPASYLLRQIREEGQAFGDCDDASMLFASLAETAGYPTRFKVQAPPGDQFKHVLVEVLIRGRWVPFDASQRRHEGGWQPSAWVEREDVEATMPHDEEVEPMQYEVRVNGMGQAMSPMGGMAKYRAFPFFKRAICPPEARGDMMYAGATPPAPAPAISRIHRYGRVGAFMRTRAGRATGVGLGQEPTTTAQPSGWLAQITGAVTQVAESAVPLLERYGVLKPRVYTPTGVKYYTPPVPVGGAPGAAFQAMTAPVAFGLTGTQILLLGGGALVLLMMMPRRR